jgi:hypothetical protein
MHKFRIRRVRAGITRLMIRFAVLSHCSYPVVFFVGCVLVPMVLRYQGTTLQCLIVPTPGIKEPLEYNLSLDLPSDFGKSMQ